MWVKLAALEVLVRPPEKTASSVPATVLVSVTPVVPRATVPPPCRSCTVSETVAPDRSRVEPVATFTLPLEPIEAPVRCRVLAPVMLVAPP